MSSVYQINKGINKPIEFKGLYGRYIGWLAGGLVVLLLTFVALYLLGAGLLITVPLVFVLGGALVFTVFRLSKRFGVHGLDKFLAKRGLPDYIRFRSRRVFTGLKYGCGVGAGVRTGIGVGKDIAGAPGKGLVRDFGDGSVRFFGKDIIGANIPGRGL